MNSLAAVHLRQARAFLHAGEAQRAVELLEKARALARDDHQMLAEIIAALAVAYREAGSPEKEARCLEQLGRLRGRTESPLANATVISNKNSRRIRWFAAAAAAVILLAVAVIFATRNKSQVRVAAVPTTTAAATLPAAPIIVSAVPRRRAATTRSVQIPSAMGDSQVRQCVALLVLLGHYEGLANGEHLQVYVPLSSAAAFVVKPSGILLSVRHLTHLAKENNFPSTLESLKLPTVTLRDIRYVACFSADLNDWIDAQLLHESDQYDIAVLSTGRHFSAAIDCTGRDAVRGEILYAWRYPAVLTFNGRYTDAAKVERMIQALPQTHLANLLATIAPEYFVASKSPGAVTVAERNIDGSECVELANKPANDNGGGPIVDALGRAIAIAEPAGKQPAHAIGILVNQLQDEISPYFVPIRATSNAADMKYEHSGNESKSF